MRYKILTTTLFKKHSAKLSKKNKYLKEDLLELGKKLSIDPTIGVKVYKNCYKIRLQNRISSKGKSGGYRVITYVISKSQEIFLLEIYSKKDKSSISEKELKTLIDIYTPEP